VLEGVSSAQHSVAIVDELISIICSFFIVHLVMTNDDIGKHSVPSKTCIYLR